MKKLSLSILISTGIVGTSFAVPLVDLKAGVGYVNLSPSGWVKYKGTEVDVKDDLKIGNSSNANAYVQIGFPVLPNVKVEYLPTNYKGSGKISKTFTFGNKTFSASAPIDSKLNLTQYDISLFYNLPVPIITPRIGLAVKYLDGNIKVKTSGQEATANLNTPIPMLYAGIHVNVPGIPVEADIEGKGISYNKNSLIDIKAMGMFKLIGLPMIGKFYIGGGYRYQKLKIDNVSNIYADIKFKGLFGEVGVEF